MNQQNERIITYYDAYQRADSTRGHLVHVIAYPQLADAIVTPTIYLAVVGYYHARGLTTGDVDNFLPGQIGVYLSRCALICAETATHLSAVILSPGIHLD